ncbi:hypothetical protein [Daejeonella oryzae]|uniref:hypothetical protein n=1 Tax=Daejeonella oryzae TaxID=1122943 RepID=UPI00040CDE45|nr:hypothetical protein [Daejeonella oryzae]
MTKEKKANSEQAKYNEFLREILATKLYESGSELRKLLVKKFSVSDPYARKIIGRAATENEIKSSKPFTFGKGGQYIYLYDDEKLTADSVKAISVASRPPIYRLLEAMDINDGVISYYEAIKLTASPIEETSTKVSYLKDILNILKKLEIIYETRDTNSVNYILYTRGGNTLSSETESELLRVHYSRMVEDVNLMPDILRWLGKCNIIDNSRIIYRNKNSPAIGAEHNKQLWDAFAYTKTTGINPLPGVKADQNEKETFVALDVLMHRPYDRIDLDGFYNRIQIALNSVKTGERKVMPIIFYREASEHVINSIRQLGFMAFDIGSIFGTKIHYIVDKVNLLQNGVSNLQNIDESVEKVLSTIRDAGQEDSLKALKGILFEFLMYPLLRSLFPNSEISSGKILTLEVDGQKISHEYDYIIKSSNPDELIFVELKGYDKAATIPLGDLDTHSSLKRFFRKAVPFAQKQFAKEIGEGKQIKAVILTTGGFWSDGVEFLRKINSGKYKSSLMDVSYDRDQLLRLLTSRSFKKEIQIIEKFYDKENETL